MVDATTYVVFVLAALALLVTPGPAVLYIVTRSIDQGRRAGIVSTLGIGFGTLFHIAAAAFGVSALLVSSAVAFTALKYLGAAYLVYLGVRRFLTGERQERRRGAARMSLIRIFYQGVLVNLLNPKTALFFFAFLPQFVDTGNGSVAGQIFTLGFTFVLLGVISDGAYAILSGSLSAWLSRSAGVLRVQRYFTGGVYVALGIVTAFSGPNDTG